MKAPGVVIGRKGSLGTVHYVNSDYWPHDTTLWIKDSKGNNPKFVACLLENLQLEKLDSGASNPTLNRNIVHQEIVAYPDVQQQIQIARYIFLFENKILIYQQIKEKFNELFQTLLHQLMTAKIRVSELNLDSLNIKLEE